MPDTERCIGAKRRNFGLFFPLTQLTGHRLVPESHLNYLQFFEGVRRIQAVGVVCTGNTGGGLPVQTMCAS